METITVIVSKPNYPRAKKLTKDDVWGKLDADDKRITSGLIIAKSEDTCPIWGDQLKRKSVTAVCLKEFFEDVAYWLEYVHGANSITQVRDLGRSLAIRSDYKCW